MNENYWKNRAELLEQKVYDDTTKYISKLNRVYKENVVEIEKEINLFINKYADENGLTFAEASKNLTKIELSEYRKQITSLTKEYKKTGSPELLARIKEIEARSVVTRLDAMKNQIELRIDFLAEDVNGSLEEHLMEMYNNAYLTTGADCALGLSMDQMFTTANLNVVKNVVNYPFTGMLFSERIWKCTDKLSYAIIEVMQLGLVQGKSIPQMAKELKEKLMSKGVTGYSNYDITRVVRTETSFVLEQGMHDACVRYGFTKYVVITARDERTCRRCSAHDGEEHLEEERIAGVTAPPYHPLCRCTTAPVGNSLQT